LPQPIYNPKQLCWDCIIIGEKNTITTTTTTTTRVSLHLEQFQATLEADFWYAALL
jgi:hypothetical protein